MPEDIEPYDEKGRFLAEFETLRPDLFFPDDWTPEQRNTALEEIRPQKVKHAMYSAIPMQCEGPLCPYARTCPLLAKNVAPLGKPCPIEMSLVISFANEIVKEWGVDTTNLSEMSMVRTYVDQEVQYLRKTKILAMEHFIQENVAGVDSDGNIVTKKELHQAIAYEDAIIKRQAKIREAFLQTRESRAKVGQGLLDPSQTVANLLDVLTEREQAINRKLLALEGREFVDTYIEADLIDDDDEPLDDLE